MFSYFSFHQGSNGMAGPPFIGPHDFLFLSRQLLRNSERPVQGESRWLLLERTPCECCCGGMENSSLLYPAICNIESRKIVQQYYNFLYKVVAHTHRANCAPMPFRAVDLDRQTR